jgi:hypothetical protein
LIKVYEVNMTRSIIISFTMFSINIFEIKKNNIPPSINDIMIGIIVESNLLITSMFLGN